jgi:hypothetical protein
VATEIRTDGQFDPCIGGGSSRDCERGECNARAMCAARGHAVGEGGPRSHLGDLIVMHGPYAAGDLAPEPLRRLASRDLNELRDELIALRDIDTREDA